MLFGIGQLESAMAEDFQPVIPIWIGDAEIITPAVNGPVRVRYATPGVVITPAYRQRAPWRSRPPVHQLRIQAGFARIGADQDFRARGCARGILAQREPNANTVAGSSGTRPHTADSVRAE